MVYSSARPKAFNSGDLLSFRAETTAGIKPAARIFSFPGSACECTACAALPRYRQPHVKALANSN